MDNPRVPLGIQLLTHVSKMGLVKRQKLLRAPLPEQMDIPLGGQQNYREPQPRYEVFGGNRTYLNYWYGNQMPGTHVLTGPHAWYVSPNHSYRDLSVQRSAGYFGQLISVLDTARIQAAAKAALAKLGTNNG